MARRCRLTSKSILIFVVGTILVAIGNSIQSLTSDECECLAVESYTCTGNSGNSPTGSPTLLMTLVPAHTGLMLSPITVAMERCILSCARFLSVAYWRKTTNGSIEVSIVPSTSRHYVDQPFFHSSSRDRSLPAGRNQRTFILLATILTRFLSLAAMLSICAALRRFNTRFDR